MKKSLLPLLLVFLALASCQKEDVIDMTPQALELKLAGPVDVKNALFKKVEAKILNLETGQEVSVPTDKIEGNTLKLELTPGNYKAKVKADMQFTKLKGELAETTLTSEISFKITAGNTLSETMTFMYRPSTQGFVIEEIYIGGSIYPSRVPYNEDKYIIITNNSDETLYADQVAFFETEFQTIDKQDYKPNIIDKAIALKAIYCIPGKGTDHPVKPGKSIIVCEGAIDHTKICASAVDLSKADFEWYDAEVSGMAEVINNPQVPDMINYYSATALAWSLDNKGATTFGLVKLPISQQEYLEKYKYDYEYDFYGAHFENSCYKIPNEWVLDAVNVSIETEFQWLPITPSLDAGWTWVSKILLDENRYGYGIKRKLVEPQPQGRKFLVDTNNSTKDFLPHEKPSLKTKPIADYK